jgi:hypothetical protein
MPTAKDHGPATQLALAHVRTLKPEHQELLATLVADPGMGAGTLETLVEHLLDEEDPRLRIALQRVRSGAPIGVVSSALSRPGATVGSLRKDVGTGGTLGGLKKR